MHKSKADSSYNTYRRAHTALWLFFKEVYGLEPSWPLVLNDVLLFLSFLQLEGYAPSTIHTYLSAINHVNQLKKGANLSADITVRQVLDGIDKMCIPREVRQPITQDILTRLLRVIPIFIHDEYMVAMYRALFTSMFFMCTRVGEVAKSQGQTNHVLHMANLELIKAGTASEHFLVTFSSFKHNKQNKPHVIPVVATPGPICPVVHLNTYLFWRGWGPGPIFRSRGRPFITASQVGHTLNRALTLSGFDPSKFGTHSFRIGRCTELARQGASDMQIRFLGRFHSNAFVKYVRPQVFGR